MCHNDGSPKWAFPVSVDLWELDDIYGGPSEHALEISQHVSQQLVLVPTNSVQVD